MGIIFKILCGILYLIGIALGYDYKEISVYICIWMPYYMHNIGIYNKRSSYLQNNL